MALNDLSLQPQGTQTVCLFQAYLTFSYHIVPFFCYQRLPAGVDVYPGVANPTQSNVQGNPLDSNFVRLLLLSSETRGNVLFNKVNDPTDPTPGAGAGRDFSGARDAKRALNASAGVTESRSGIIESSNIVPLDADSNIKKRFVSDVFFSQL